MSNIAELFDSGKELTLQQLEDLKLPMHEGLVKLAQIVEYDNMMYIYTLVKGEKYVYSPSLKYPKKP